MATKLSVISINTWELFWVRFLVNYTKKRVEMKTWKQGKYLHNWLGSDLEQYWLCLGFWNSSQHKTGHAGWLRKFSLPFNPVQCSVNNINMVDCLVLCTYVPSTWDGTRLNDNEHPSFVLLLGWQDMSWNLRPKPGAGPLLLRKMTSGSIDQTRPCQSMTLFRELTEMIQRNVFSKHYFMMSEFTWFALLVSYSRDRLNRLDWRDKPSLLTGMWSRDSQFWVWWACWSQLVRERYWGRLRRTRPTSVLSSRESPH